ncbi:MAG: PilZ domain-containing protein [Acidobacteriota bacterium]
MSERRSSPRIDKVHLVQVSRFDEEGFRADLTTGRTLNISRGGVRLELHHSVPLRTVVSLNLVLGERIVDVRGTVVYLEVLDGDRCGMGIEFDDLDPEIEALLDEFVSRHEQGEEAAGGPAADG